MLGNIKEIHRPQFKKRTRTKKCPFCAEIIQTEAVKCRYCFEFIRPGDKLPDQPQDPSAETEADEELEDDEGLLYWGRPSVFAVAREIVGSILLLFVAWMLIFYPVEDFLAKSSKLSDQQAVMMSGYFEKAGIILAAVVLLYLLIRIAAIKSISYEVTVDRIEWARGIFSRKIDNLDMYRITDLKLHRSISDCILGIGTVVLVTKDKSDPQFEFTKIRAPKYLYDAVKKASLDAERKQGVVHLD